MTGPGPGPFCLSCRIFRLCVGSWLLATFRCLLAPLSTHCCPGLASRGHHSDLAGSNPDTSWHGHDPTHCMPEAGPARFPGSNYFQCSGHGRTSTHTGTCISKHPQAPTHRCKLSCPKSCSLMEHICEQKPDTMPQADAPCHPGINTCGLSGPGQGHQQGRRALIKSGKF